MTEAGRRLILGLSSLAGTSLAVASCASPSDRIASGLGSYGLSEGPARCMGDRLQSRLKLGQLQQLGRAAETFRKNQAPGGRLGASDLIRAGSQVNDVKVPLEVTKAAVACGALREAAGVQGD